MTDFFGTMRRHLYPVKDNVLPPHKAWRVALGFLCALAIFTGTGGRMYSDGGWALNGIPVPGYVLWVILNVYLGIGVCWELFAPRDDETRKLSRGRRWSLATLATATVAVSVISVGLFPGAGPP